MTDLIERAKEVAEELDMRKLPVMTSLGVYEHGDNPLPDAQCAQAAAIIRELIAQVEATAPAHP